MIVFDETVILHMQNHAGTIGLYLSLDLARAIRYDLKF
jgi:hypothetical protein